MDFAHFCARTSRLPDFFGAGGLADLFARGLPGLFTGGFARLLFLSGALGLARLRTSSELFLLLACPRFLSGALGFACLRASGELFLLAGPRFLSGALGLACLRASGEALLLTGLLARTSYGPLLFLAGAPLFIAGAGGGAGCFV